MTTPNTQAQTGNTQAQTQPQGIYARQAGVIPETAYDLLRRQRVMIIGLGAIGCQLADTLYRMADFQELVLCDHDLVDTTNLVTQSFFGDEIGQAKVAAIKNRLRCIHQRTPITAMTQRWDFDNVGLADIVFACVDNIDVRGQIFERVAAQPNIQFFGDIRLAGNAGQVFTVTPANRGREYYPQTLFPSGEAATGRCVESSYNGTSKLLTGMLALQFCQHLNGIPSELHLHYIDGRIIADDAVREFNTRLGLIPAAPAAHMTASATR
jgi:molybdopterin/thiamine biosynthesis adenylyltransferase